MLCRRPSRSVSSAFRSPCVVCFFPGLLYTVLLVSHLLILPGEGLRVSRATDRLISVGLRQ